MASQRDKLKLEFHPTPFRNDDRVLLIILPGLNMSADDLLTHGLIATLHDSGTPVDLLVAEIDLEVYLEGDVAGIVSTLVAERRGHPYRQIWLGGISLGGFGALLAATAADSVEGVILLAPFLGTPGFIAEVERGGGLASWQPGAIAANDHERQNAAWLKSCSRVDRPSPTILLAYGRSDRFAASSALLAAQLPPAHCFTVDGGHDWPTWTRLWQEIIDRNPFSSPSSPRS